MSLAADWRLVAAIGGTAGLAVSPFWAPAGDWLRPLLVLVLVAALFARRSQLRALAMVLVGVSAVSTGLTVGGARIASIDGGALNEPPGPVVLHGFATEAPSDSRGTARFGFDSNRGRVLVETAAGQVAEVTPGSGLEVSGDLGPAAGWMRADLERRGISMVLRADRVEPDGEYRSGITGWVDRLRERALAALAVAVPDREAALSRGFVLGDDSEIDRRTTEDFRSSGLGHLLAVSGQNIVLLALLAVPFLSLFGIGPRARLAAIALLILVYIPLAGGGPSIQRAGVMGLAGLVAVAATRAPSRLYALASAALVTLLLNPRASGDIGWQLSFAAVVGIMLLARPFQVRLEVLIGDHGWRRALCEGIAITLAATIATAPLGAFHFERLPVATLLANLFAMPAVAPAMWLGMIGIAVGQAGAGLAAPFNLAGSVFLGWIAQVAEWFGRPGWAVIEINLGPLQLAALAGVLGLASWMLVRFWQPGKGRSGPSRWLPLLVLLALIPVLPGLLEEDRRQLNPPPAGGARVEILDVGQGDAILIRPAGEDPLLIDGGPPGGDLAGALDSAGVDRLAAVLLTHPDLDHYGGLLEMFGLIPVDRFLFDRSPPELTALATDSGAIPVRVSQGELVFEGNLRLEVLWPPADAAGVPVTGDDAGSNSRSIVVVLGWRGFRMLLTGDAEAESVPMHPGPIDVLKVSHHGSADAGLPVLLDETMPRLAVIPVGSGNSYGHPVPEVLAELSANRIPTLRTDQEGTVSIVLSPNHGFQVETGK